MRFENRNEAGKLLAQRLREYANRPDVIVLALPRGGVPVAFEIAQALNAPLDILAVRKLGVPGREELAMGAIASGGVAVLNDDVVESLHLSQEVIDGVAAAEQQELSRREQLYRDDRSPLEVQGRTVLVVDDGLATGTTMQAALAALRLKQPAQLIVAIPVAPLETWLEFSNIADRIYCLMTPEIFYAVGAWYHDFSPTSDKEVCTLLELAAKRNLSSKTDFEAATNYSVK